MSERLEVLDLVITVLREHEKKLDDLTVRFELCLNEILICLNEVLPRKSKKRQSPEFEYFKFLSDDIDKRDYK
jgi:hypothetical protein